MILPPLVFPAANIFVAVTNSIGKTKKADLLGP